MTIQSMQEFKQLLNAHGDFILSSHIDPDGDGLGGMLGLGHALQQSGKKVHYCIISSVLERYRFLPGIEEMSSVLPDCKNPVFVSVDAPNLKRLGFDPQQIANLGAKIVNIDHHTSNERFGEINIVDESSAASCEVIADLLQLCALPLPKNSATSLYTGLLTDTGRFRFSNTNQRTLKTACFLLEKGAEHNQVIRGLYENFPVEKLILEQKILSTLKKEEKLAWIFCTKKMLEETGYSDTEDIVNRLTEINGIEVVLFFREVEKDFIKISLRSRNHVDVNQIASQFGGGGHTKAAGARMNKSLDEAISILVNACQGALKNEILNP